MTESLYNDIPKSYKKNIFHLEKSYSLAELVNLEIKDFTEADITKCYIDELKRLLEIESVTDLIEGINQIQVNLTKVQIENKEINYPTFENFFSQLAPLLLQKFWERSKNIENDEDLEMIFFESIFIALEEEVYIWQEKISS